MDVAIHQIISRAVSSDEVVDIFAAAGLKKSDIERNGFPANSAPPDKQEKGTQTVLQQAESLCAERVDQKPASSLTSSPPS